MTGRLAAERRGWSDLPVRGHPAIDLHPAGHIDGSRAALIHDDGCRILYTGDVCTRARPGIEGFDPVTADVLIIEATYGSPDYEFPPVEDVTDEITEWVEGAPDVPLILYGYALGRAQRIIRLFEDATDVRLLTTEAIQRYNDIIAAAIGDRFDTDRYDPGDQLAAGDALLVPTHAARREWLQDVIERTDAVTAGFTGWAIDPGYQYRRSVDVGFPLSDHCDYPELLELVDAIDPEIVYTHHGFAKPLARDLTRRGFDARALMKGQTTLDTFG